jgi:hypothetical protein
MLTMILAKLQNECGGFEENLWMHDRLRDGQNVVCPYSLLLVPCLDRSSSVVCGHSPWRLWAQQGSPFALDHSRGLPLE